MQQVLISLYKALVFSLLTTAKFYWQSRASPYTLTLSSPLPLNHLTLANSHLSKNLSFRYGTAAISALKVCTSAGKGKIIHINWRLHFTGKFLLTWLRFWQSLMQTCFQWASHTPAALKEPVCIQLPWSSWGPYPCANHHCHERNIHVPYNGCLLLRRPQSNTRRRLPLCLSFSKSMYMS